VRVLLHTGVVKYLEFKAVDGSYVLSKGKIHKVRSGCWAVRSARAARTRCAQGSTLMVQL